MLLFGSISVVRSVVAHPTTTLRQAPSTITEQDPSQTEEQKERVFEDSIPKHVPLKIKIKRERLGSFKDLRNKNWAKEFELEVTNTGEKPIYEFFLLLVTDVIAVGGYRIVTTLNYGRPELAALKERPNEEDVPLLPGETLIMTIDSRQIDVWELMREREKRPDPTRVQIKLQGISFGDGTAYMGNEGLLLPRKIK